MKNKLPVRYTGQHFTINKAIIDDAIRLSNIDFFDTVLDVGAGKGNISLELANICNDIYAIEKDPSLISELRRKFQHRTKINIIESDFLKFKIPQKKFKVVSNIPYNITSKILEVLMMTSIDYFEGGTLFIPITTANKLFGKKVFNPYIVFYHTYFDIQFIKEVSPNCFFPPPTIKSVLIKIARRHKEISLYSKYFNFLKFMMKKPESSLRTILKKIFRKKQIESISMKYSINLDSQISLMRSFQWEIIFKEMILLVPEKYHPK
jgi:23S rRNA (adenine-N6)-dimethyltransferase